jgi:hypothetical protein
MKEPSGYSLSKLEYLIRIASPNLERLAVQSSSSRLTEVPKGLLRSGTLASGHNVAKAPSFIPPFA